MMPHSIGVRIPGGAVVMPTSPYWNGLPTPKQAQGLALINARPGDGGASQILYGGAVGGGKSEFITQAALQWAHHPSWSVLIVGPNLKQLRRRGSLMQRILERVAPARAAGLVQFNGAERILRFPEGATIEFGIMPTSGVGALQTDFGSSEYSAICIDEAGQFPEEALRFFPERFGRTAQHGLPAYYLLASNPVGPGFQHLYDAYYAAPQTPSSYYLPARLADNPHLNAAEYRAQLAINVPEPRLSAMLNGDWVASGAGALWTPEVLADARLARKPWRNELREVVIGVDPSGSAKRGSSACGLVVVGIIEGHNNIVVLEDHSAVMLPEVWRRRIYELCDEWQTTDVVFESDYGAELGTEFLQAGSGWTITVHDVKSGGRSKYERAMPVASLYSAGLVSHAPGLERLERQMSNFYPETSKDADAIDAAVHAIAHIDGLYDAGRTSASGRLHMLADARQRGELPNEVIKLADVAKPMRELPGYWPLTPDEAVEALRIAKRAEWGRADAAKPDYAGEGDACPVCAKRQLIRQYRGEWMCAECDRRRTELESITVADVWDLSPSRARAAAADAARWRGITQALSGFAPLYDADDEDDY